MSNFSDRRYEQMQIMAKKLKSNSDFMAWVISTYQKQEHLSQNKFIELAKINEIAFIKLSLCKRPETSSAEFRKQIDQISEYVGINPYFLANMIRLVESLESLAKQVNTNNLSEKWSNLGFVAARDRQEEDDTDKNGEKNDLA